MPVVDERRGRTAGAGPRRAEGGHLLVILMIGVTVMLIMLTAAAQSWTFQMRREMELELIFRGEQYIKALDAFRRMNGGAFPVGDLKILARKNAAGVRFIRKLYRNPFDPNGEWQYLYLHPGGTGFINPCATVASSQAFSPFGAPAGTSMQGQIPVSGMPLGGGLGPRRGRGYSPFRRDRNEQQTSMSDLSAVDPNAFREHGLAKMNLPIVGVVDCENKESIRIYKGQTWLANWAFTPLAQGEFAGNVQGGSARGAAVPSTGHGLSGSEFYPQGMRQSTGSDSGLPTPWRRGHGRERPQPTQPQQPPEQAPPPQDDQQYDDEAEDDEDEGEEEDLGDEDGEEEDEEPGETSDPSDPDHAQDPNRAADSGRP